jgi:predicted phosphoadenosine phosphosulfate sulfurtransferase
MKFDTFTPDLTDPDWLPSDEEEIDILRSVAMRVVWEHAMAARGIRVLEFTQEQQRSEFDAWLKRETAQAVLVVIES